MVNFKMSSKIPGFLPPMPKTGDGKLEKLDTKTKPELLELIERQNKLISNKRFLNSLPDKGEKVRVLLNKLKYELALREQLEKSCALLSKLSIVSNQLDKNSVDNLEWEKHNDNKNREEFIDSDDDSEPEDPLAIVAQSRDVKKKIIILKKEAPLITADDLKEVESFAGKNIVDNKLEEYCENLFDKTVNRAKYKENFKPYKTTTSNCHDPSKEKARKKGKHWEITAATPEPSIHGAVKEIPLKDSLLLLDEQNKHLREVQTKHAAEKLAAQLGQNIGDLSNLPSFSSATYRVSHEINSEDSDEGSSDNEEGSDKEVLDEEPHEGGVVFTVMN